MKIIQTCAGARSVYVEYADTVSRHSVIHPGANNSEPNTIAAMVMPKEMKRVLRWFQSEHDQSNNQPIIAALFWGLIVATANMSPAGQNSPAPIDARDAGSPAATMRLN